MFEKMYIAFELLFVPFIIALLLTIVNYQCSVSNNKPLLYTDETSISEGVTEYSGFGLTQRLESNLTKQVKTYTVTFAYNQIAGNVETWGGEINLDAYEKYADDFIKVNGSVLDSEEFDGYEIKTFSNNESIKVIDAESDFIPEYTHDVNLEAEPLSTTYLTEEETMAYLEYENGLVTMCEVTTADVPLDDVLTISFSAFEFFKYYLVLFLATLLIALLIFKKKVVALLDNRLTDTI